MSGGTVNNNTAASGYGHAVYVNSAPVKQRNSEAGAGVDLDSAYSDAIPGDNWE
jgi:hypothetical protein